VAELAPELVRGEFNAGTALFEPRGLGNRTQDGTLHIPTAAIKLPKGLPEPSTLTGTIKRILPPAKTVGVIGGIGPLATVYFLQKIVEMTDADQDQSHIDTITLNHATLPDRTAFLLGKSDRDPGPALARDALKLESLGVDFIVMPCNTAHYFTQKILDAIEVPFLSIIDATVKAARARDKNLTSVGLLATPGTIASQVYHAAFERYGISVQTPNAPDQDTVMRIIYDQVKAGLPPDVAALQAVADRLAADHGVPLVVLGCTELSVIAMDYNLLADTRFIDSLDQLVRATIEMAGRSIREPIKSQSTSLSPSLGTSVPGAW